MPSRQPLVPADYAVWLTSPKSLNGLIGQQAAAQWPWFHLVTLQTIVTAGLSSSNLKYMRFFAQQWTDGLIGQQPADQLSCLLSRRGLAIGGACRLLPLRLAVGGSCLRAPPVLT